MKPTYIVRSTREVRFFLYKNIIKESCDYDQDPYVMTRAQMRRVFRAKPGTFVMVWYYWAKKGRENKEPCDARRTWNLLVIGCQRFTGRNLRKLAKWTKAA